MARRAFYIGDPAPDFVCDSTSSSTYNLNTAAGRYAVLTFLGTTKAEQNHAVLHALHGPLRPYFNDAKVAFFGVSVDPNDKAESRLRQLLPGMRFFWDFDGKVSRLYGAIDSDVPAGSNFPYQPFTLVLDPLFRILHILPLVDAQAHNAALAEILEHLPPIDDHAGTALNAPVLILPRVFEQEFCRELIAQYEQQGGVESGFMREKDGKTIGMLDSSFKRRKDFSFDGTPEHQELRAAIRLRLERRLKPEIKRAFQFNANRLERYVVSCYDAETGGFFRPHRDNTTKATMHRRFACTINLNAEEYEGGNLRFPEFGSRLYRAPTGGAVVFSCSLMHEATPVTQGKRYAFLPFFYDETTAKLREENEKFIDNSQLIDPKKGD